MDQISNAPSTAAAGVPSTTESLSSFASRLLDQEAALARAVDEGRDLTVEFSSFVRSYLADDSCRDIREKLLVSHSLLRIFKSPELRGAAIDCSPYLDIIAYFDAPRMIIEALGKFAAQDPAVCKFLASIVDGNVGGNLSLNKKAVNLARQILNCQEIESGQDIPSREELCRLVGIQL